MLKEPFYQFKQVDLDSSIVTRVVILINKIGDHLIGQIYIYI
jgi:hypothetical protein